MSSCGTKEITNNLLIKCNDNEQHSRKSYLHTRGIENDNKYLLKRVKKCWNALDLPFCEEEIDRVHRIGKEYKDKNSGKNWK